MNSDKIDGSSSILTIVDEKNNEKTEKQQSDEAEAENTQKKFNWQDYFAKAVKYSATSFPIGAWKGIDFKLHGFVIAMIIVDVCTNLISTKFYLWAPYALFRNLVLFSVVILSCLIRIKFFGSKQLKSYDDLQTNDEDEEKQQELETKGDDNDAITTDDAEDDIEFKSVIISYLGGFVSLKKMSNKTSKRIFYFGFPLCYYFVMAFTCFIVGLNTVKDGDADGPTARNFWFWLRNATGYCMLMCLLPVPGFDGAALLTIYLKKRNWNGFSIILSLVLISLIVIVICGFKAITPPFDIIAGYIAIFCGIKLLQYAFNAKDDNMKVLRTMAKTTKKLTEADLA